MNAIYILCHFNREKRREKMTDKHLKPLLLFMLLCSSAAFAYEQVTYYHNDALGSPIAASDSEGKILWRESYQPYGERQQHEPRANANRRWFTSHVEDADTGLLYMQARYYDPRIGRFMSQDPVGFVESNPMSFNRYAYANNNPYKYVDPDGRAGILIPFAMFLFKETAAETASRYTGGLSEYISVRKLATKGGKFALSKLSEGVERGVSEGVAKKIAFNPKLVSKELDELRKQNKISGEYTQEIKHNDITDYKKIRRGAEAAQLKPHDKSKKGALSEFFRDVFKQLGDGE